VQFDNPPGFASVVEAARMFPIDPSYTSRLPLDQLQFEPSSEHCLPRVVKCVRGIIAAFPSDNM
jgi:hypothetical protein